MLTRSVKPRQSIQRSGHLSAPMGGINRADSASAMSATDCLSLRNMCGSRYGLKVRPGHREWCTGLGAEPVQAVRSILSFAGSTDDSLADRLFACTTSGIWDVTTSSSSPSRTYDFPTSNASSGRGVGTGFVTIAGHFYAYCDEENGYILYTQSTDTWGLVAGGAGAGEINGVDPRNLAFVTLWKSRLLFVEKDSANMWYLPVGQVTGTVTKFDWGNKFLYGGALVGLWNWTIDGGVGVDDYLVAVSRGGDVAVYYGTDPSDVDAFAQKGMWFVGGIPAGRRIATNFGGDILLLSSLGVVPLSKLLAGGELASQDAYATRKLGPLFAESMKTRKDMIGWEIRIHPEEGALIIATPQYAGQPEQQFVMSLSSKGWGEWVDLPLVCAESWKGKLYFGTLDGRVCVNDGAYDNVALDGSTAAAYDVEWSGLSAFQANGNIQQKQIQMIRTLLRVNGANPRCIEEARYDFDERVISTALEASSGSSGSLWGTALWGTALWSSGLKPTSHVRGAVGIGSHMAIAWKGSSHAETILIGFDVSWTEGGIL